MGAEAVIFDFDYTLADSSIGAIECVNYALEAIGLPATSAEAIRRTIGLPLSDIFLKLVGRQHTGRYGEFLSLFVQRSDEVMADNTIVFESVPSVVKALKSNGVVLGIASTKFRYRIETILGRERLLDLFDVIVGGEDVLNHKPDPEALLTAVKRLACSPSGCLYVGDSVTDAETAARAEVPFVAVLSGVTPREEFRSYPTYAILGDLTGLPGLAVSG